MASNIHLRSWNISSLRVKKDHYELSVTGFPESAGERAENDIQLIACLSEMTHVNIGKRESFEEGKLEIWRKLGTWK